jgi:hypothetical protein
MQTIYSFNNVFVKPVTIRLNVTNNILGLAWKGTESNEKSLARLKAIYMYNKCPVFH